jgi:hypothetical protein
MKINDVTTIFGIVLTIYFEPKSKRLSEEIQIISKILILQLKKE